MMNIKMSKDELKEMVDNICHLVMNVSWGKQIVSEWNGDSLFVYADPNAYEPEWDSLDCDLDDIGSFVMSMTGLNYAGDADKHLIAICWHDPIRHDNVIRYEIRKDVLDDGEDIYDIYEVKDDGENGYCEESFQDRDNAVKYIRETLNWKGEIK